MNSSELGGADPLLDLIQAEYREMPGLCLTKAQMRRLWGLDTCVCDGVVAALVDAHVLRRTASGTYVAAGSSTATQWSLQSTRC